MHNYTALPLVFFSILSWGFPNCNGVRKAIFIFVLNKGKYYMYILLKKKIFVKKHKKYYKN